MILANQRTINNEKLLDFFSTVRSRTEALCKPLRIEDYVPQPEPFVSPPKWHLAHTTWFFEEMILSKQVNGYERFHPDYAFLFNSYYNTVGKRTFRADRGSMTRPGVDEVYAYRAYVNEAMASFIATCANKEVLDLIELGLNHEQQHQELLITDLKYTLSLNPMHPVYHEDANWIGDTNADKGWLGVPEGMHHIGHRGDGFCFDNELNEHRVFLEGFEIRKALVTNGEYLDFIEDGGYASFKHWLDEGWSWVQENEIAAPLYWKKIDGEWFVYTLAGLKPLDPHAILSHVSYYEANAFAAWKGMRLPTEFEWEAAAPDLNWGKRWEWTNSAYLPYPGFAISDGAVGEYNGKFMVNQMVLRGASVVTAKGHSRATYRNFFHPHFQWQYAGIRLAK